MTRRWHEPTRLLPEIDQHAPLFAEPDQTFALFAAPNRVECRRDRIFLRAEFIFSRIFGGRIDDEAFAEGLRHQSDDQGDLITRETLGVALDLDERQIHVRADANCYLRRVESVDLMQRAKMIDERLMKARLFFRRQSRAYDEEQGDRAEARLDDDARQFGMADEQRYHEVDGVIRFVWKALGDHALTVPFLARSTFTRVLGELLPLFNNTTS